jgi:hypothetical protein
VRRARVATVFGLASAVLASAVPAVLVPATARAAEVTEIASASGPGDKPQVFVSVDYAFEAKRAAIKREWQRTMGGSPPPAGVVDVVRDLLYQQDRHILTPRLAIGFYDIELNVALPIIVSDTREMRFDQSESPCIFPPDPDPTCVNRNNSSTIMDGILPTLSSGNLGYDAEDPATGFDANDDLVFRGVNRSGLDQIHIGLNWAALNQTRDDTKPTWVIGAEVRVSIGKIMKFNRDSPGSEDGVSRGVHEFVASTRLSKRTTWAEPFVSFWWKAPIGVRGDTPGDDDSSLFWNVGFGQENQFPQQEAGTEFGLDAFIWERPAQKQKLTVELRGRVQAHFEGRNYTEVWELLSLAGDASVDADPVTPDVQHLPLVLDSDPTMAGVQALSHPGITDVENYLSGGARLGLRGQIGERAKFSAAFELGFEQGHIVTFTDAGDDTNENTVVDPGTAEENPLHKQIVDTVGRRYIVDDSLTYTFMVNGTLMFGE